MAVLTEWNSRHNLVSANSLKDVWRRHVLDSIQLARYLPDGARTMVDLGSGAGLPGLLLAAVRDDLESTLIEATKKKCAFLETAATAMGVKANIRNARIEDAKPEMFDVIVARACSLAC